MSMSISAKGVKMSKIKEELQRIQDNEFEQYVSFMEWVCDQKPEVRNDVNEAEEDSKEPSTKGSIIVHQNALNNPDYNPKLGA